MEALRDGLSSSMALFSLVPERQLEAKVTGAFALREISLAFLI